MSVSMVSIYSREEHSQRLTAATFLRNRSLSTALAFTPPACPPSIYFLSLHWALSQWPLPLSSIKHDFISVFHSKESIWTEKEQAVHLSALF